MIILTKNNKNIDKNKKNMYIITIKAQMNCAVNQINFF